MNVRQADPLGLGHSVLCARPMIGDNPFVVVLPDVLLDDSTADHLRYNLAAMVARFEETGRSQVLAKHMPNEDLSEYGVLTTEQPIDNPGDISTITSIVEKPEHAAELNSDLTAVGRYVLSADIWAELEKTEPGAWGRIQLTDAIASLSKTKPVDAQLLTGTSFDCGRKLGYMQAFVSYGLRSNTQGRDFREAIHKILDK